jgi:hypothetical protein
MHRSLRPVGTVLGVAAAASAAPQKAGYKGYARGGALISAKELKHLIDSKDPKLVIITAENELRLLRLKGTDDPRHAPLLAYERKGGSTIYSFYGLPAGCDTVFFPGCALPGTRPDAVSELFEALKQVIPNLGIVLDCCLRPSHDRGRRSFPGRP